MHKAGNVAPKTFFYNNLNYKKIKDYTPEEASLYFMTVFVRAAFYIGIKDPINQLNKDDIKNLIYLQYRNLTFEELNKAFTMERYNLLEPKTEHYQIFGTEYVGAVLKKFVAWKRRIQTHAKIPIFKPYEPPKLTEEEKEAINIKGICDLVTEFALTKRLMPGYIVNNYDYLYKKGLLPKHTKAFRKKINRKAINRLYKNRKKLSFEERKFLKKIVVKTDYKNHIFRTKCCEIVLEEFLHRIIATNTDIKTLVSNNN